MKTLVELGSLNDTQCVSLFAIGATFCGVDLAMSDNSLPENSQSRKYALKIFEPFVEIDFVLDVPLTSEGVVNDDILREEVNSFVFEQLESGSNVPFEYAVHAGVNGDEIWLSLGKFTDQSGPSKVQTLKEEIESLNKKHAAKIKSLESRLEAELLTRDVEFEEKEIALQKEVITLRLKHAKDTQELRSKVTEYEEKIRCLEEKLANLENSGKNP